MTNDAIFIFSNYSPMSASRKLGCVFAAALLFAVWLAVGIGLYKASLLAPPQAEDEDSKPFEIIPSSED